MKKGELRVCMEKKLNTIAFANNKGGSGKTTTCANVGYSLAAMGHKVLLIDGDMQLNLSLSFFAEDEVLEFAAGEKNLYQAILRDLCRVSAIIRESVHQKQKSRSLNTVLNMDLQASRSS